MGAAAGEGVEHDDLRLRADAGRRLELLPNEEPELVQQRRPDDGLLRVGAALLGEAPVRAGGWQRDPAHALVLHRLVLVRSVSAMVVLSPRWWLRSRPAARSDKAKAH